MSRNLRRARCSTTEPGMAEQAVARLVPERPAVGSEKPAEPGARGDEALVTGELLAKAA